MLHFKHAPRYAWRLIVENYRRGQNTGAFQAIGLFLDLSGFSTMTDALMQHGQHGAEVLANLMHGVFDPLVESIFNFGENWINVRRGYLGHPPVRRQAECDLFLWRINLGR